MVVSIGCHKMVTDLTVVSRWLWLLVIDTTVMSVVLKNKRHDGQVHNSDLSSYTANTKQGCC